MDVFTNKIHEPTKAPKPKLKGGRTSKAKIKKPALRVKRSTTKPKARKLKR